MLGDFLTRFFVLILGYAYPAFECFKTVEKNKVEIEELRFWCQYWILVAFLTVFERIGDLFISWLPMYGEMKITILIYLWYPKTKGTAYIYDTLLRPFMARHETEVDRKIQELRARAWDVALFYWQNFAAVGQAKFFEILTYLAGQSSRFRNGNQEKPEQPNPPPPPVVRTQSGKNKNWPPATVVNRSTVESPRSKLVQFKHDNQSENGQGDHSAPDSPMNSRLEEARLKLRRGKGEN